MDLKIKDVAELLNVSETTIRRWLSEGKIPAYRLGQQYRFSRNEIEDWVMGQQRKSSEGITSFGESAGTGINVDLPPQVGSKQFSLFRAIHKGNVIRNMPGKTKEEVIRATMKLIAKDLGVDAEIITELLLERETLQPTALNNGIGIPHTREFLLSSPHDIVTVVFPEHALEYGALDGEPVHTLFFLFACDDKKHLHLLAKIAHLSSQSAGLQLLKAKPSKEALLSFIQTWESGVKI
jgi:nitrogen PTS system EIIA component